MPKIGIYANYYALLHENDVKKVLGFKTVSLAWCSFYPSWPIEMVLWLNISLLTTQS